MPSETTPAKETEKDKKKKKSLEGQTAGMKPTPAPTPPGLSAQAAFDRTRASTEEGGKRAAAEAGVANALVQAKVQPTADTPERRAEAWAKANGKVLGIGNRAAFFGKIKQGLSPEAAWKAVGGK
jgi:hypothetical protein